MIHQFRDKKQIAKKKKLMRNLILLFIFLILSSLGVFMYSRGFFYTIGRPIWKMKNIATSEVNNLGYITRSKASVYKKNENLSRENSDLKVSMIDYNILKNENIELKESLGRIIPEKNMILSNILTKPNYSPYDTIIIDIGTNSGVNVGNQVYANVVTPIGEISVAYSDNSLVTLYSNPGEVTEAMMDGTNTSVELVGRGGGNFEMTIPTDLQFVKGGIVYLPNISSEIIAIIQDVISSPNDPAKKLLLSSPVNVQELKWVFVKRN